MTKKRWIGEIPPCDFCGKTDMDKFVDGRTAYGPWAIMCPKCHKAKGFGRFGLGLGQKYEKGEDGIFWKVAG